MSSISLVIFLLFLVAGSLAKDGNTTLGCFPVERNALLKFKASFSDPSSKLSSWNSTNMDCCKWQGIQCDRLTGHVSVVDLRHEVIGYGMFLPSRLTSENLDPSIMELKHLSILDLSGNDFQLGNIPASIGTLNQLQYLNLSHANLSGVVPQQLGNLSQLSVLDLGLSYDHPLIVDDFTWLSRLSSLTHLDMSYVNLTSTKDLSKVLDMLPSSIVFLSLCKCGLGNRNLQHACSINSTTLLPNIQHLDLSQNLFVGEFPCFLKNKTSLRDLDLSYNSFQWTVNKNFKFFQNNCNLELLYLGSNSLSGDISNIFRQNSSKCLGRKLAELDLGGNNFYGQLPEEVGGFKKLEYLGLGDNNISGPIPTSISNLSSLKTLDLSSNKLNGSIPFYLGNLTSLTTLDLIDNQLGGEIPTSLGQLQNLVEFYIHGNYFQGTISESHFANLSNLQHLYMGNDLTKLKMTSDWKPPFQLYILKIGPCEVEDGQFPKWLETQNELEFLHMPNCNISEAIPKWLRNRNLNGLLLPDNRIQGSLPESLCEMNSLTKLDLSRNRLSGYLPECLANLTYLSALLLSSNQISGVIPNYIGGAYSLRWLQLNDNNITGELPSSLRNCSRLGYLDIGHNKISGRLPEWIGKDLMSLENLRLTNNNFYGTIPFQLCQLSKLQMLNLANNKLTGHIPHCFGNFSNMMILSDDPTYFGEEFSMQVVMKGVERDYSDERMRLMAIMDLSNNNLAGEIPSELTKLVALKVLNLSHNHLQGMIPGRIGEMKSLESLDLSNNNLFGNIPASLSDLDSLGFLNLSHNNLSGEIPTGRHLQTLDDPWNYEGNPGLCGATLLKKCNGDKARGTLGAMLSQTDEAEHKADKIWFYGVMVSGFATGFWGAIGVLVFKRGWRFAYFGFADDIIGRILGR